MTAGIVGLGLIGGSLAKAYHEAGPPVGAPQKKPPAGQPGHGAALTPNYLRLSQAERERLEREQQNS